jgi:8-oxo-dGTP pyrophosphatase MutT (NUDIX family)
MLADCHVFKVRRDSSSNAEGAALFDFYCLEAPDWINVIPLTSDQRVVMIEQYRHGSGEVTLEIPGGMVDQGESAATAAARELFEETGFGIENLVSLGASRPNPAIQDNWIHNFVALNVSMETKPEFDSTEHTTVRMVPLEQIPALIADGTISHALVILAFYKLNLYNAGLIPVSGNS